MALSLPPGEHDLDGPIEAAQLLSVDGESGLAKVALTVRPPQREVLAARSKATILVVYMSADTVAKMSAVFGQITKTMGK